MPVNTTVRLTFTRRLHKDSGAPEEVVFPVDPAAAAATPVHTGEQSGASSSSYSAGDSSQSNTGTGPNAGGSETPQFRRSGSANNTSNYNFNTAPPGDQSYSRAPSSPTDDDNNASGGYDYGWGSPTSSSHLDPVQYVAAMAENEELRSDLETALQQLKQTTSERDRLSRESHRMKEQLAKCRSTLAESQRRQAVLQMQLDQGLVFGVLTSEQLAASTDAMLNIATQLQIPISALPVSGEVSSYMRSAGLDAQDTSRSADPVKVTY